MAADVATLSLKLEASQFVDGMARAKAATDGLTRSQTELVAKADKLVASAQSIDITNKKAVQTYLQEVAAIRATAQQMGALHLIQETTAKSAADVTSHQAALTRQMQVLKVETGLVAAEQKVLGAATGLTSSGLNAVRASATSLAASLVGTAPGVAQLSGALGTMALGSGLMIGVLAGMAALAFAWDKITEGARKAKKETEDALDLLDKLRERDELGPAGQTGKATRIGGLGTTRGCQMLAILIWRGKCPATGGSVKPGQSAIPKSASTRVVPWRSANATRSQS